jgi:hypothetical protein
MEAAGHELLPCCQHPACDVCGMHFFVVTPNYVKGFWILPDSHLTMPAMPIDFALCPGARPQVVL